MPRKSNYRPIKKSRKNDANSPSAAKKASMKKVNSGKKKVVAKKRTYRLRVPEAKPAKQLPETPQTKKGLTLRKLLRGTPRLMHNNSAYVDLLEVKQTKTMSNMPVIRGICVSHDPYRPNKIKRKHKAYIIGIERDANNDPRIDKSVNKHRKVLVSCSCENFLYTWEYANSTYGASRIIYCNGEPPLMTNPALAFGLCKHLVALARDIIQKDI